MHYPVSIINRSRTCSLFMAVSVPCSAAMVPVRRARIALAACSLRTSPWCSDWSTSCESETVLDDDDEDDEDDDDDSYASLTSFEVDTRRSAAALDDTVAADGAAATIFTGFGRAADMCCSGDTLDTSTGGDSGNVTSGSPVAGCVSAAANSPGP